MKNILDEILEVKKEEVKLLQRNYTFTSFKDSPFYEKDRIQFLNKIKASNDVSIISEIKKASPSKGLILENFNHLKIADIYMNSGADTISVLTDKNFFQGDIRFLRDIAAIKAVPLLRKDFIIDEYQIFEAKSNGADIILLIAEALSESQIKELTHAAFENDLEVLLELHSADQLTKIDFSLNGLIGINNRDLTTFKVDLMTTLKLREKLPDDVCIVSESGIKTREDIDIIRQAGAKAVLIGEHFMKASNISDSLKQMKEWCSNEN